MNIKNNNSSSFTTVELLVSISMILILTGMFLLNYQFQGKFRDLTDANHIILQRIREVQNMTISQSRLPTGCGGDTLTSYGVFYKKDQDFFDIFAEKDEAGTVGYLTYNLSNPNNCTCAGDDECIERILIPATIKISRIRIDTNDYNDGWVNFLLNDLSVIIKGDNNFKSMEVETCIKSDCVASVKRVIINNKGMAEIQD